MPQVKATRMALLNARKRIKLAQRGYKLLKEKRDALVMEFFGTLKEIKKMRTEIGSQLAEAQDSLFRAQALQGEMDVERFSLGISKHPEITLTKKSVMAVEIPEIGDVKVSPQWYGYLGSTTELDTAVVKYRELLPVLLKLSVKQLALQRLADDIKKTKRKVNSLEYIILPRIEQEKKLIQFKLEELERENFTRLKKIKERSTK
jgi:V/A-type H+-transporting ATPase subunit D